jgi:hypothetical protein
MSQMMGGYAPGFGFDGTFFLLIVAWSLFWKALALWHSARRGQPYWFAAMLLINTAGILEIVYLFAVAKVKGDQLFKK